MTKALSSFSLPCLSDDPRRGAVAPYTIEQPYRGRWNLTCGEETIGFVNGDAVIGFTARDGLGSMLGSYGTSDDALDIVVFVAQRRSLRDSWDAPFVSRCPPA